MLFRSAAKNLEGKQLEALTQAIFWTKAQNRVRSVEASMDKEVGAFMDKKMVSGKSATEKKGKKTLTEEVFWARARDRVRSVEASMDKEMVEEKRKTETKGKKKGRELADGVLARTSS